MGKSPTMYHDQVLVAQANSDNPHRLKAGEEAHARCLENMSVSNSFRPCSLPFSKARFLPGSHWLAM